MFFTIISLLCSYFITFNQTKSCPRNHIYSNLGVKLISLTQPQILKSRRVFIEVYIFLILIAVEVMNKQRMVVMDKIDVSNFLVLEMEKLEDDKMKNPHGLFTLLWTFTGAFPELNLC